jgi:hypothetical protein
LFTLSHFFKFLVKHKKLDPKKKIVIKNPLLAVPFFVAIMVVVPFMAGLTLVMFPITIPLSRIFPKNVRSSLDYGTKITLFGTNYFSMTWGE